MVRLTIPFDVEENSITGKITESDIIKIIKSQLNYCWKFISIKHFPENSAYDYKLTVERLKDCEPYVPPFPPRKQNH